jgi:hypothetical protein
MNSRRLTAIASRPAGDVLYAAMVPSLFFCLCVRQSEASGHKRELLGNRFVGESTNQPSVHFLVNRQWV